MAYRGDTIYHKIKEIERKFWEYGNGKKGDGAKGMAQKCYGKKFGLMKKCRLCYVECLCEEA